MADIQRKIVKLGKRSGTSRLLHGNKDKETIAGWKSVLNRILHIFNVGSVAPPPEKLLTAPSQTELIMGTHVAVSDIHATVSETHAVVSDIRHDVSKIREEIGGHDRSVSPGHAQSISRRILTAA